MSRPAPIAYRNEFFDAALARTMAGAYYGTADLGETRAVVAAIGSPTPGRWHEGWSRLAEQVASAAGQLRTTDPIGARGAYLRASEYYRQAGFFLRGDLSDPRLSGSYRRHVEMFAAAMPLLDCRAAELRVPFKGTTLKALLFGPADTEPRPTVLFPCGYDSTAEAGWVNVPAALERGYRVVVFEGPGQGEALIDKGLYLRPDFSPVLSAVIDVIAARPEVDAAALVLVGRSFAGYLAPQAATVEHRIAALVCDPGQPDLGVRVPAGLVGAVAVPVVRLQMHCSGMRREFFRARMAAHGIDDVADYFTELRRYTMADRAGDISCPTLVVDCAGDFAGGQSGTLYDLLTCRKAMVRLDAASGGAGHCAGLGQRVWESRVYPWLAARLSERSETGAGSHPAPAATRDDGADLCGQGTRPSSNF